MASMILIYKDFVWYASKIYLKFWALNFRDSRESIFSESCFPCKKQIGSDVEINDDKM